MRRTRLGILDAVPAEYYISGEKTDPQKFIDMFEGVAAPFEYATYLATEDHFPDTLDDCDAYLITGSPCSVYDTYTWIGRFDTFIRSAHERRKPMVGICFGHQLIARALGGRVRLAEDGWLLVRSEGRMRHYRLAEELDPIHRNLWSVVREGLREFPVYGRDAERARQVLAERKRRSAEFFAESADRWTHPCVT